MKTMKLLIAATALLTGALMGQSSNVNGKGGGITDPAAFRAALGVDQPRVFRVRDYGAKADGVTLYDGTYTNGSTTFTSVSASFTSADVGKKIVLQLSQATRQILTISSVTNSTTVVMNGTASANSSAYTYRIVTYGTDNSTAIQSTIDAAGSAGGEITFDGGVYLCTAAPVPTTYTNSIFHFPYITAAISSSPSFKIKGVGSPNFAHFNEGQRPGIGGTVIYCPNQPAAQYFTAATSDVCTSANHGFTTGQKVNLSSTGTLPAGLTTAYVEFYVVRIDANTFKLASSRDNAVAGTPMVYDITGTGSGTHRIERVNPSVFAVVPFDHYVPAFGSESTWGSVPTMLNFEGITIRQIPATRMDSLQQHLGGALLVSKCSFDLDVPYSKSDNLLIDPNTGGATACAIIPPSKMSAYWTKIENCYIYGYSTGIRFTDNVYLDQVIFEFCVTPMEGTTPYYTNGMSGGFLSVWRCRGIFGGHICANVNQINFESGAAGGFMPNWAINNTKCDIDNYDGHKRGKIGLFVVDGNVGARPAIVRVADNVTPTTANTLVVQDLVSGKTIGNNVAENLRIAPVTSSPAAPTLATAGTAGSTTYKYKVAYNLPDGSVIVGPEATITTGNTTLTSTNKIVFPTIPFVSGSCSLKIYRTAGPATLGLVHTGYGPNADSTNYAEDTGAVGDGVVPVTTAGRVWFNNNTGTWDGANLTGPQAFTSTTRPTSAGTGTPNATDLVTRADMDARAQQTITHILSADLSNGTAATTVDTNTLTIPVGKWTFVGAIFVTRNTTTSNVIGAFNKVSGASGGSNGRQATLCYESGTYNSHPYGIVTGGCNSGGTGGDNLMYCNLAAAASGSKTMLMTFSGRLEVLGSPMVMRFEVTQATADAGNPAILKAKESYIQLTSCN